MWKALLEEQRDQKVVLQLEMVLLSEKTENSTVELFKMVLSALRNQIFLTHNSLFPTKISHYCFCLALLSFSYSQHIRFNALILHGMNISKYRLMA